MVYIAGIIGFIGGFVIGQLILLRLLKDVSQEELLKNKNLGWTYGVFNWFFAIMGAVSTVYAYNIWFNPAY